MLRRIGSGSGSIRQTLPPDGISDPHRAGADREHRQAGGGDLDSVRHTVRSRIDLDELASAVDDPHVTVAGGDAQGPDAGDPGHDIVRARADPGDGQVGIDDPDRVVASLRCAVAGCPARPGSRPCGSLPERAIVSSTSTDSGIESGDALRESGPELAKAVSDPERARPDGDVGRRRAGAEGPHEGMLRSDRSGRRSGPRRRAPRRLPLPRRCSREPSRAGRSPAARPSSDRARAA